MASGIVKWFSSIKKFGFIATTECTRDVFVHEMDVENPPLIEDQHVEFEIHVGLTGPQAKNVKVVPKQD